jgi:hypothetical protein
MLRESLSHRFEPNQTNPTTSRRKLTKERTTKHNETQETDKRKPTMACGLSLAQRERNLDAVARIQKDGGFWISYQA